MEIFEIWETRNRRGWEQEKTPTQNQKKVGKKEKKEVFSQ